MIIQRERLQEKLNCIIDIKLTLIIAPAGYGKTTAICSWLDNKHILGDYVWVSLSEGENEPVKFWTYFFLAIEKVHSGLASNLLSLLLLNNYWSINDILVLFINQTVDFALEFLIILDDFHHIKNAEIQEQFDFLIEHLSKNIHVVVISRTIPEFYTPRINLSCETMLIQSEDLKFSEEEIVSYFSQYIDADVSMQDILEINEKTEGWIGLFALMAEKIREDTCGIKTLSDENNAIFEYFDKEIMNAFTDEEKDFLVKTSALDTFSPQMCMDILEIPDVKDILQSINKHQLLTYYYENGKSGYRYCSVFSEFLNAQFDEQYPNSRNLLYMKTSVWCENKEKIHDAINYALKAGNVSRTLDLLEKNMETILQEGSLQVVVRTIDQLPEGSVTESVYLALMYSLAQIICGDFDDYETCLKLNKIHLDTEIFDDYQNEVLCIRAICAHNKGLIEKSMRIISQIDMNKFKIQIMNGLTEFFQGNNYRLMGDMDKALECFNASLEKAKKGLNIHLLIASINDLAFTNFHLGKLEKALRLYSEGIHILKNYPKIKTNVVNMLYLGMATIKLEKNRVNPSLNDLIKSLEISSLRSDTNFIMQGKFVYSKIMFTKGDHKRCLELIDEACSMAVNKRLKLILCRRISDIVRMLIQLDQEEQINRLFSIFGIHVENVLNFQNEAGHIAIADYWIHQGKNTEALKLLEKLAYEAGKSKRLISLLNILLLKTLAYKNEGKKENAISTLKEAIKLSYGKSICNTFLNYGQPIAEIFAIIKFNSKDKEANVLSQYCYQILNGYGQQTNTSKTISEKDNISLLTSRENEVLKYLCMGCSNREIMEKMCVSINTVKKHIQNIYQKLEVENRAQAIQAVGQIKKIG